MRSNGWQEYSTPPSPTPEADVFPPPSPPLSSPSPPLALLPLPQTPLPPSQTNSSSPSFPFALLPTLSPIPRPLSFSTPPFLGHILPKHQRAFYFSLLAQLSAALRRSLSISISISFYRFPPVIRKPTTGGKRSIFFLHVLFIVRYFPCFSW